MPAVHCSAVCVVASLGSVTYDVTVSRCQSALSVTPVRFQSGTLQRRYLRHERVCSQTLIVPMSTPAKLANEETRPTVDEIATR